MDRLQILKTVADNLSFKYHHNVGEEKLEEQLKAYCTENSFNFEAEYDAVAVLNDTSNEELKTVETTVDTSKFTKEQQALINKFSKITFVDKEKINKESNTNKSIKEAMKLVRCKIVCNNPNKTDYTSDIFSVQNRYMPEVKRCIPFNKPWHIPQILLNTIKERKYQHFTPKKPTGGGVVGMDVELKPEFTVEILAPISTEEFNVIKQRQLADGFDGK